MIELYSCKSFQIPWHYNVMYLSWLSSLSNPQSLKQVQNCHDYLNALHQWEIDDNTWLTPKHYYILDMNGTCLT